MNAFVDRVIEPGLWLLLGWSLRWTFVIGLAWLVLAVRPPRRAALRHLVCLSALFAGLLLPFAPAWGPGFLSPKVQENGAIAGRPDVSLPQVEIPIGQPQQVMVVPEQLPAGDFVVVQTSEPSVGAGDANTPTAAARNRETESAPVASPAPIIRPQLGTRRWAALIIAVIWAAGLLFGLARIAHGLGRVRSLSRAAQTIGGAAAAEFAACCRAVGANRTIRLATHAAAASPLAVGPWRPTILVPGDWETFSVASRRGSLLHELQHLSRYDDWRALFAAFVRAVFFFHPAVYWLLARLEFESELLCDEAALTGGVSAREYAQTLLEFARRPNELSSRAISQPAGALPFGARRTVKRRILRLLDAEASWALPPWSRPRRAAAAFALAGIALAAGSIKLQAAGETPAENRQAATANKSEPATPIVKEPAAKENPKRKPPARRSNAGRIYDTESVPIVITGRASDEDGRAVKGAKIYLAPANGFGEYGPEAVLADAVTDAEGAYVMRNIQLPVRTYPPEPEVVEGKFQVFGVADGYGFTWHGVRSYRPRPRPAEGVEPEMERAFYEGEDLVQDLTFGPEAIVAGRVADDLGNALAGATVQVGVINDTRRPAGGVMWRMALLDPENGGPDPDRTFAVVTSLPRKLLEATADEQGRFRIGGLPRESSFLSNVVYRGDYEAKTGSLATTTRQIGRTQSVGSGQEWNPVLTAPRVLRAKAVDAETKAPLADIAVRAFGRSIRMAGALGRTDAKGEAVLRLAPGHYKLIAEPAPGVAFIRSESEADVAEAPAEQTVELAVDRGALVELLAVDAEQRPVEGVGFSYETDTSRDRRELQSQTVFVDHPLTHKDGKLRAVVEPGRRKFLVAKAPDGFEPVNAESEMNELAAGSTTSLRFELRRSKSTNESPGEAGGEFERLQELWRRQHEIAFKGEIIYRLCRNGADEDDPVSRDDIRSLITSIEFSSPDDVMERLDERFPAHGFGVSPPMKMTLDGPRCRIVRRAPAEAGQPPDEGVEAFNGVELVRYDRGNAQADVGPLAALRIHIDGIQSFCNWPFVPRRNASQAAANAKRPKPEIAISNGKVVVRHGTQGQFSEIVADRHTGFLHSRSYYRESDGYGQDTWQFDQFEVESGKRLARMRLELHYNDDAVSIFEAVVVDDVKELAELPPDAFVVSVPAGTNVLAYDESGGSAKQGVTAAPLADVVAFANSLSPKSRSLWPVLKIGEPAPALDPAAWLNRDGPSEAPEFNGKLVLIDFWGQGCGPCMGELPQWKKLAQRYADRDLVIVGCHDSSGDVQGVAALAKQHGLSYPLAIDREADEQGWFGAAFKSYGVRAIPQCALLGRDGRLLAIGHLNLVLPRLVEALEAGE